MERTISVFMTAGSMDEARCIARALIDARLAACVNILGPIESVFYWNGIQEEQEIALIAKATRDDFDAINEKVREVHSYDCPCVVAWPMAAGDGEFLDWIVNETRGKRGAPS